MNRRRFLPLLTTIPAYYGCRSKIEERTWTGILFNSPVAIRYNSDSDLSPEFQAEILRLESIFSLYHGDSALSRLNDAGFLDHPPSELLALLARCREFHRQSNGLFDPSIQTYWTWLDGKWKQGEEPSPKEREEQLALVDFNRVSFDKTRIELGGTRLTLNSVAQGFITDSITRFLVNKGVTRAIVNLGEYRAIGGPFQIAIRHPDTAGRTLATLALKNEALAVSSGSGHRLTATGSDNHILSPQSGTSPPARRTVVVRAPDATAADAWATILALDPEMKTPPEIRVLFPALET